MLEVEPHVAGIQAIHVPEWIVNYKQVCLRLGEIIEQKEENQLLLDHQVNKIKNHGSCLVIETNKGLLNVNT